MFTADDYTRLHEIVFSGEYPGYRPEVRELPNGDGRVDAEKRYAHVAEEYLAAFPEGPEKRALNYYLDWAHREAVKVAYALGVPREFYPVRKYGALRVLEYPAGVGGVDHADFDLFTLLMYRDKPANLIFAWTTLPFDAASVRRDRALWINPGMHIGELGEEVGLGKAHWHRVQPCADPQHSIVYFAIPDWAAVLPSGVTVGDWIAERIARSRVVGEYK